MKELLGNYIHKIRLQDTFFNENTTYLS